MAFQRTEQNIVKVLDIRAERVLANNADQDQTAPLIRLYSAIPSASFKRIHCIHGKTKQFNDGIYYFYFVPFLVIPSGITTLE